MLRLEKISKSFGELKAVNEVSLEVSKGEIFGLLGPNGAGKSTTINIISTLLEPDQGEIFFEDFSLSKNPDEFKKNIGVVPQEISLYENLSASENLKFWGELYNIPSKKLNMQIEEVLELVGLSDRKNDLIKTYSGGMKRRINIAASILHKPKLLLMDEPTVGIDPQSRNRIFEVVKNLNNDGMAIIYTTHYMEEAEKLCNKIAIIDLGKIIAEGNLNQLKKIGKAMDMVQIFTENPVSEFSDKISVTVDGKLTYEENKIVLECKSIGNELTKLINDLNSKDINIKSIESKSASLESVFLHLTGKQLRD